MGWVRCRIHFCQALVACSFASSLSALAQIPCWLVAHASEGFRYCEPYFEGGFRPRLFGHREGFGASVGPEGVSQT